VIPAGDVTEDVNDPCWSQLSEVLAQPHAEGFIVNTTLIDSGFQPQTTYAFCERHPWRAYPSRGESNPSDYKLIGVKDLAHVGSKVIGLNTSALKEEVFTMLQKGTADGAPPQEPFPGHCSFPIDYPSSFFSMLCAEERTVVRNKQSGRPHLVWKTKRPGQANHALDARVYAYAALLVTYALRRKEIKDGGSTEDYNWQSFWNEAERMLQESEEGVRK
jgi:phage terminase large subunit GpA-like protein